MKLIKLTPALLLATFGAFVIYWNMAEATYLYTYSGITSGLIIIFWSILLGIAQKKIIQGWRRLNYRHRAFHRCNCTASQFMLFYRVHKSKTTKRVVFNVLATYSRCSFTKTRSSVSSYPKLSNPSFKRDQLKLAP